MSSASRIRRLLRFMAVVLLPCLVVLSGGCGDGRHPVPDATTRQDSLAPPIVVRVGECPSVLLALRPVPQRIPAGWDDTRPADFTIAMPQYNTEQGLALSAVTCGYRDRLGHLWFGTGGGGVSRFDGYTFTTFTTTQGLGSNTVWSICEDSVGAMWFGTTGGGVSRYDGVTFTTYTTAQGLAGNTVYSITLDRRGHLWFGTFGGGVSEWDGTRFTTYGPAQGLASNAIQCSAMDRDGNLWFGSADSGVSRYDGEHFVNFGRRDGLPARAFRGMAVDHAGNVWFGTIGGGAAKWDGARFTTYTMADGLPSDDIYCIAEDHEGRMWFGTVGAGACTFDGTGFTHYGTAQGMSHDVVLTIVDDRSYNLWFGTLGGGLCRFDGESLRGYTTAQGLPANMVWSMAQDAGGSLWFGMEGGHITRFDGRTFMNHELAKGLPDKDVLCIMRDRAGNLWFGTHGAGAFRYDGRDYMRYTTAQGLPSNSIRCMAEDRDGGIWFGTNGSGVCRFDGSSFTTFTKEQGLAADALWCIAEDSRGDVWFGTDGGGISRYDGNRVRVLQADPHATHIDRRDITVMNGRPVATFTTYTTLQGLAHNQVYSIAVDSAGRLWCGTAGGGVSRFDGRSFLTLSTLNGLPDDNVYSIKIHPRGDIVLGTNRGLTLLTGFVPPSDRAPAALLRPGNDRPNAELRACTPMWEVYNQGTGQPIKDVNTNALFCDRDGVIWAGTGDQLLRFDRAGIHANLQPPVVVLHAIKINNTAIAWRGLAGLNEGGDAATNIAGTTEEVTTFGAVLTDAQRDTMISKFGDIRFSGVTPFHPLPIDLVLPYNHNSITIEFNAIEPSRSALVRYQYMLEGYDDEWSAVTDRTTATFGNMDEGHYTFVLRARSPEGVWSAPVSYSFRVLPPFWRTWWMYLLYVASFISGLWGFIKWRERASRREREILRASEERYRLIVETANEGVWRFNQQHRTIFVNTNMCTMLECTADEMLGRPMTDFMDPADRPAVLDRLPDSMEVEFITKSGKRIWVHAANSEVHDDAGRFTGALAMVTDITERRLAEDELRRHREHLEDLVKERTSELNEKNIQLDAANRSKSEFLANMSHEIRTPMNSIIGFSDVLHGTLKDEKQRSQVDCIRTSGRSLLKIINDILDLSKIEAGKMTMQYEPVNLPIVIQELEMMFRQRAEEKGIALTVRIDDDMPQGLSLDETRLRQVLFNLVGNAVKFTERGGVTLSLICERQTPTSTDIRITVQDTGIGIPRDQQDLIFAPFTQQIGQQARKFGGTGLGLTISQRLVEMMNGAISVSSEPGVGSTFTVLLPDVEVVEDVVKDDGISTFTVGTVQFAPAKVLIVDDNDGNRMFLSALLEGSRLTLAEAVNGQQAVELVKADPPDLILMDLLMPVMNGHEATRIIRGLDRARHLPIIAVSASLMAGDDPREDASLFDAFLMKPINGVELIDLLKQHLEVESADADAREAPDEGGDVFHPTAAQRAGLPRLLALLESEHLPRYFEVSKRQLMGQIREFGVGLRHAGDAHDWPPLSLLGHAICDAADEFDVDKLMKQLRRFPDLIQSIKAQLEV